MTHFSVTKHDYFSPDKLKDLVSFLRAHFSSKEPCVVLSAPYSDLKWRIDHIIQDYKSSFLFPVVRIDVGFGCEDISSFAESIKKQGYDVYTDELCVVIPNADFILTSKNITFLRDLIKLHRVAKDIRIAFCFEMNIFRQEISDIIGTPDIYANTFYYPLLDNLDASAFVRYSCDKFGVKMLSKKRVDEIVRLCGGHTWLLKHAVRIYKSDISGDIKAFLSAESTQFRIETIANQLSQVEKNVISSKSKDRQAELFLTKIGIIDRGKCTIPILAEYLTSMHSHGEELITKNGSVYFGNIDLQNILAKNELKVLRLILANKSSFTSYDQIADTIWGESADEHFSMWAITQLIKRLRAKLKKIGIEPKYINTKRNQGYQLHSARGMQNTDNDRKSISK